MSKTPIEVYDEEIRSGASLFEGIDAVAAHARREALEEAAKIAEDAWLGTELTKTYFNDLATAIRALLRAPPGSGGSIERQWTGPGHLAETGYIPSSPGSGGQEPSTAGGQEAATMARVAPDAADPVPPATTNAAPQVDRVR